MPGRYPGYDVLDNAPHWDPVTRALILDRVDNVPEITFFTPKEASALRARAHTGPPPRSRMISGTAREVIRLWITVSPGCSASARAATSAVIADGDTGRPRSSTTCAR